MSKRRVLEAIEGYLFLLPNFLGFLIFFAFPLAISFYYSFTDYNLFTDPKWVGLANYVKALSFGLDPNAYQAALSAGKSWTDAVGAFFSPSDPTFWTALRNTIVYALGVLALSIAPAFILAWMLNSKLAGMTIFRALIYIPVVASIVGSALVWFWIFQGQSGILNTIVTAIITGLNSLIFTP